VSKTPAGKLGPGGRERVSRSPAKAAGRRRRARRIRWTAAGAAVAVVTAVITVIAVAGGPAGETAGGTPGAVGVNPPGAGTLAPAGRFTTVGGATRAISSLRGQPALVWLVTTWCPGCQAGTQAMPADLARLAAHRVRVVELEDYADLGQPGPGMAAFGPQFAGAAYRSPDWVFGTASQALTQAYNPQGYLDIYYLLDSAGRVVYVNSAPASTMDQLLARAARLR
jgi:thiol-disulfide isomerase/thioredoxin